MFFNKARVGNGREHRVPHHPRPGIDDEHAEAGTA